MGIERKYFIAAVIWAIIGAIGFLMALWGSSPAWFPIIGPAIGIVGTVGSWLAIVVGAAKKTTETILQTMATEETQKNMQETQKEMYETQREMVTLLREIRDTLEK